MKRLFVVLSVILLAAALIGCTSRNGERQLEGLQDGTYYGFSEFNDNNGWAPFMKLVVEEGIASSVRFDYAHREGGFKSDDAEYARLMESRSGVTPADAAEELAGRLLDSGTLPVDTVTGATASSDWFNRLAEAIIPRAKDGDTRPVLLVPDRVTYTAEDQPDERGWIGTIAITYERQTITSVSYDEIQRTDGEVTASKAADPDYARRWEEASGVVLEQVYERLGEQLRHEGRASGVDIISGATAASRRFRTLAMEAEKKRSPVDFVTLMQTL